MLRLFACLAVLGLSVVPAAAQMRAVLSTAGLSSPVFGTTAPGNPGLMYIVQQGGNIRTFNTLTNTLTPGNFFTPGSVGITDLTTGGEQGMLGMAFHPNFQSNGHFYLFYTANSGNELRVDQLRAPGGVLDTTHRVNVISVPHPTNTNHNGGWIGFNPANPAGGGSQGYLYIATGDGGGGNDSPNNAQNTNSLLGKMLRVDVGNGITTPNSYAIPSGNMTINANGPIAVNPTNIVRPEIYAYGLRNPWRNSFDRGDAQGNGRGNMFIADVGQSAREEINFIANGTVHSTVAGPTSGSNFGWRLREGFIQTPTVGGAKPIDNVDPIFDYVRTIGAQPFYGSSVTGGYVYRGPEFADGAGDLNGTYVFADYVRNQIGTLRYDPSTGTVSDVTNRTSEIGAAQINGISSFAEDGFGNLYYMNLNNGTMYKLVPVPEPALLLAAFPALWAMRRLRRTLTA